MDNTKSYISFIIGNDRWAIPTSSVEEIVPVYNFYEPPSGFPDYVIGVINYRGSLLNLIDVKQFLSGEKNKIKITDKVLVIGRGNAALLVDDVEDIILVKEQASPSYFTHINNTYRIIDLERMGL